LKVLTEVKTPDDQSKSQSIRVDSRQATRVLLVLTGVALLVNYVETMVIPGVPTIQRYFSTTSTIASWITSAYLIVGSAASPLFGKFGDIYGKKRMFLTSLVFYMVGVAIAGFSPSIYVLLFARALQGVGFAIVPLGLAIITDVFPRERVATAQGIISGTFAIGAALGLIIGSYVVQDLGWQYAFHTALIISLVLFAISARVLKKDLVRSVNRSVDYVGAVILISGVTLILLYLTEGPSLGWLSNLELGLLIPGVILTIFFFFFENKKTNPLVSLALLRIRDVLVANLVGLVSGVLLFLLFFAVTYYSQLPPPFGLGLDVVAAGLTLGPSAIAMFTGSIVVGRELPKIGPKPVLLIGSGLLGLGLVLLLLNRSTSAYVALGMFVALGGFIAITVPIVNMLSISVPRENIAVGLGMNTLLRNLGGAIGPVVATSILSTYTQQFVSKINGQTVVGQLPSATAFNLIFEVGIILVILVASLSLATKNYTFKKAAASQPGSPLSGQS
jgi:MFS family permease